MSVESKLFDLAEKQPRFPLSFGYNSVSDWMVAIYDRKGKPMGSWGEPIITTQSCDRHAAIAEAYFKFTEFLCEECGGY